MKMDINPPTAAMTISMPPTLARLLTNVEPIIPKTDNNTANHPATVTPPLTSAPNASPIPPMNIAMIAAIIPNIPTISPNTNSAVRVNSILAPSYKDKYHQYLDFQIFTPKTDPSPCQKLSNTSMISFSSECSS